MDEKKTSIKRFNGKKRRESLAKLGLDVDYTEESSSSELNEDSYYTARILGTDLASGKKNSYTVYKIEMTLDISSWIIYRRYSQFYSLLQSLKSEYGTRISKGFPPKKFIQNLSPHHVDRRHQKLQEWLNIVLNDDEVKHSMPLQLFIKQGKEDTDFVPKKTTSTIESDIDMASSLELLSSGKWKTRWFVLRHGILYKYQDSTDKHPFGFYDLRGSTAVPLKEDSDIIKPRPFVFTVDIKNKKSKTYFFAAESEDTMSSWISKINNEETKSDIYRVFGTPIENVRDRDANGVPLFLSSLTTFLEATALDVEDLFTKPPDEEIKRQIDRGKLVDVFKVVEDVHAVAGLIIQYLHELPEPIIPKKYNDLFFGIFKLEDEKSILKLLGHFSEVLPLVNRNMLLKIFSFIEKVGVGSLKYDRLIKLFGRLVLRPPSSMDSATINSITKILIDHWDKLIVLDEIYQPPEKVVVVKKRKKALSSTKHKDDVQDSESSSTEMGCDIDDELVVVDQPQIQEEIEPIKKEPRVKKHRKGKRSKTKKERKKNRGTRNIEDPQTEGQALSTDIHENADLIEGEDSTADQETSDQSNDNYSSYVPLQSQLSSRPKVYRVHKPTSPRIMIETHRDAPEKKVISPQQQLMSDLSRILKSSRPLK